MLYRIVLYGNLLKFKQRIPMKQPIKTSPIFNRQHPDPSEPTSNQKTPPELQKIIGTEQLHSEIPEDKFRDFRETRQLGHRNAS
ncbi:hypothetical protein CEXT_479471 [Caerostris extrusa]|uniref:Uncharacterized protein n=1 Tax=Caerostris extrusa TaxID=172846 RepID=A0AAV4MIT3_CAEEX|nr:hypothetical protein CEXT_479471 [Caerostris extrusa]